MPIFIGKNYTKFQEAKDLVAKKGAFCIQNSNEFEKQFEFLRKHEVKRIEAGEISKQYINQNLGASQKIIAYCADFFQKKAQ